MLTKNEFVNETQTKKHKHIRTKQKNVQAKNDFCDSNAWSEMQIENKKNDKRLLQMKLNKVNVCNGRKLFDKIITGSRWLTL